MKIHIPNSAFLGNIDPFFRGFDPSGPDELIITANEKWISVHPVVLAMLAALGTAGRPAVRWERLEAKSAHYLQRMGLFALLNSDPGMTITEHEPAGRFIPLTQIYSADELTRFITDMVPLLHLDPEPAQTIGYVVSELVRNVIEHADSPHGAFVCAQYYKKSNTIRLGIADTGRGIKKAIGQSYTVASDMEAIKLALWPGITGTTRREGGSEQNAGAGLFFIKSIAWVNRDFFVIYSGTAMYKLLRRPAGQKRLRLNPDPFKDRHSTDEHLPPWPGTIVGIDISLDQTEEFTRLLDALRGVYVDAVRERRQARYKKPRFT